MNNCFYGPTENPALGIQKLSAVFKQNITQAETFCHFLKERETCENAYASKLLDFGKFGDADSNSAIGVVS
jgi:hypothetical protein